MEHQQLNSTGFPPDFVADVVFDRTKPLDLQEVYQTAMWAIAKLAWKVPGLNDIPSLATPRSRYKLEAGHMILGMYKAVGLMAQGSAFCTTYVAPSSHGQRARKVSFARRLGAVHNTTANSTNNISKSTVPLTLEQDLEQPECCYDTIQPLRPPGKQDDRARISE